MPTSSWTRHIDGSSNAAGAKARLILTSLDSIVIEHALYFNFKISTSEAKYEPLFVGLRLAWEIGIHHLQVLSDSQLMVLQV